MFSVQIHTLNPDVLQAFARMFTELSTVAPTVTGKVEMTGQQYIDSMDRPDAGVDVAKSPAAVFTAGTIDNMPAAPAAPATQDAAAVFGASPIPNLNSGAPFTAGAEASLTAPVVTQGTSTSVTVAPPPAPPSADAAATAAAPTPPASPVLLDSTGLPWDVRIHAGTRTQTQKGVWKARKGVDDATVAQVTAELRQVLAMPVAGAAAPFVPLNVAATVAPPAAPATTVVAPPPPPPAAAAPGAVPTDFASLCRYVTGRQLPADKILAVCNKHGLAGLGLLALKPALVAPMYADFAAL